MKIEFTMLGVPTNWANFARNRFVMYAKKKEWLDAAEILGRSARIRAESPIAEKGHKQRLIAVTQFRNRFLDKEGLYVSCKPIIDGLKTVLKVRNKDTGKYENSAGAGLIYDDNEDYVEWVVTQVKCKRDDEKTIITIEIP